jgi:hypothetical protein
VLNVTSAFVLTHPSRLLGLMQGKFSIHLGCPCYAWQLKTNLVTTRLMTEIKFGHHNFQSPQLVTKIFWSPQSMTEIFQSPQLVTNFFGLFD